MQVRESENLRSYLVSQDQYKKTGRFKENIKNGNNEIIPIVLETIQSVIKNKREEPMSRLNALRLLKECVEVNNETFNFNVETDLLNTLNAFAIQLDRKTLLKSNPTQQEEKISMSFYILCLECIKVWAHWYPDHKGVPSQFKKIYQNLKNNGFKFPGQLNFFKNVDLYKYNPTGRAEYMRNNIKKQVEALKNLTDNEDYEQIYQILKDLDYFLRHSNEITQNLHDDIPEDIIRDTYQYQSIVAQLHQNLNEYKKGNIDYFRMKSLVQNQIDNYESSTHQRSSNPFLSHKSISPNSSDDFDLKCENVILSQQNVRSSLSILDEKQINNILNRDYNNNSSLHEKFKQTQHSIDHADFEFNKQTENLKSNRSAQSNQIIFQKLQDDFQRQPAAPNKDFNFSEQQKLESLEERIAALEKTKESQTSSIELLIVENKKLQNLVDQKQDDIDLLEGKKTYFSYSTDYQTLLCTHQKLEQDFNELSYKYNNFEHEKQIIVQENEHLKQQQESLKDMNNTQKETIKQLQLRVTSLQKDVKILEDERENFKKDCERKYQINQLITLQQISKNEQSNNVSFNNRIDVPVNQSPQISCNSVRFSEKDFMRGLTVAKNQKLLSFLNNDDSEVNSYSFKLGCLRQSVNIYENEYIKVLVSKIDQAELAQQLLQQSNGVQTPVHMGLNISILNKSNINIKHFEIQYHANLSVKIMTEGSNKQPQTSATFSLNSQNVFQQKIYIETNTVPFQIPEMTIRFQSNYINKVVTIPLPITVNGMLEYETIIPQSLNDIIGMWNNSPADSIYKSAVFTVSKQLIDKKTSLHQFFPTFSHVQSSSINFYELVGLVKIPLANKTTAAVKITLVNDRFICFQIKSINTNTKSLSGNDSQPPLKNIHTNTLQFIIQTFQELFSDN